MKRIGDEVSVIRATAYGSAGVTGSRDKIGKKKRRKEKNKYSFKNG